MAASKAIGSLGQGRVVDDNLLSNIDKNILKKNAAANKKAENLLKPSLVLPTTLILNQTPYPLVQQ